MNGVTGVLASRQLRRWLPWASALVVAAGVVAAVVTFVPGRSGRAPAPIRNERPTDVSQVPKTVKLDPAAVGVAREFIKTAVARKNLERAWSLAGPDLRGGMTLAEWKTGEIPVVPYPADAIDFAPYKIDYSYPGRALIEIALLPKKGAKIKPQLFMMRLEAFGRGAERRWLVTSWVPKSSPKIPDAKAR